MAKESADSADKAAKKMDQSQPMLPKMGDPWRTGKRQSEGGRRTPRHDKGPPDSSTD